MGIQDTQTLSSRAQRWQVAGIALATAIVLLISLLAADRLGTQSAGAAAGESSAQTASVAAGNYRMVGDSLHDDRGVTRASDSTARCTKDKQADNPTCRPSYWRKKFKKGDLGRTKHGHKIPQRIKKMLKKEYRQHHRNAGPRDDDSWLQNQLSNVACIGGGFAVGCAAADEVAPKGDFPWKRVTGVAIICGQAAWNATMTRGAHADPRIIAVRAAGACLGSAMVSIWADD